MIVPILLAGRVIADQLDRQRIRDYVARNGGAVTSISWNPFGRGWFGERGERIYEVTYRTREGKTVSANCKTSLWSGVYWTGAPELSGVGPEEPTECLSCGTKMPARLPHCPKCGWSYERP